MFLPSHHASRYQASRLTATASLYCCRQSLDSKWFCSLCVGYITALVPCTSSTLAKGVQRPSRVYTLYSPTLPVPLPVPYFGAYAPERSCARVSLASEARNHPAPFNTFTQYESFPRLVCIAGHACPFDGTAPCPHMALLWQALLFSPCSDPGGIISRCDNRTSLEIWRPENETGNALAQRICRKQLGYVGQPSVSLTTFQQS